MTATSRHLSFKSFPRAFSLFSPQPRARCPSRVVGAMTSRAALMAGRSFTLSARAQEKKYTEEHEWIELGPDGNTATVGITDYAAKQLGDVVFIELPAIDLTVSAGDTIGAVESVKSASDILTPAAGTIVETNTALEETPKTINVSPEADGWIAKIRIKDQKELHNLMDREAYVKFTDEAS